MLDKLLTSEATLTIPAVGFRLLSSEVRDLTPEEVKAFRAIEPTSTERELSERRVDHLAQKINAGLGVTFNWVTAQLKSSAGEIRRINGQHSSTMLAKRCLAADGKIIADDPTWPKGLKVLREHYEVEDGDGLALLFRQFDDRRSGRSPLDISGVYQGLHPELNGVNRKIAKLAIDGYSWFRTNVEKVPGVPRGDDSYSALNDSGLWPLILWLNTLLSVRCKEMKYPQVVAAITGTYLANEGAARAFWQDVVNLPDGDDDPSPQSVLTNWLLAIEAGKIERPAPANVYQGCVHAWNAYRDGKTITAIRDDIKKNFYSIHE